MKDIDIKKPILPRRHTCNSQRLLAVLSLLAVVRCCHSFQSQRMPSLKGRQNLHLRTNFWTVSYLPSATLAVSVSPSRSTKSYTLLSISAKTSSSSSSLSPTQNSASTKTVETETPVQGKRRIRPVTLTHERDFFRQAARLESMDSYLLVSTLTASMSFGALLGFQPSVQTATTAMSAMRSLGYGFICSAIPVIAGFSALFGLYATIIFSLTVLYGKSKCAVMWDTES
jgi:hypothetical protein